MAAPGKKFSFGRLINNAVPNFAKDDPNDVDLTPQQADQLLAFQLASPYPRYLGERSFFIAGVVGADSISKKVHTALVKNKMVLPVPEASSSSGQQLETLTVNTGAITDAFASQLAVISVHAQRKVVGMLFFWEEECMRWKLLDEEEKEILAAQEANGGNDDLAVALASVRMKMKLLPSQRGESTANVGQGAGHVLPTYS